MAAILLSQGDKDAAEENWRLAVKGKPDYAEAHYNLAVVLSESGDDAKLSEASRHCELAIEHKENYVQAHHLMGNIRMSQGAQDEATRWYAKAEALGGDAVAAAPASAASAAASSHRWEGVEVGHVRTLRLPDGTSWSMETLSMRPLAFLVRDFLSVDECERLIALAKPRLKQSLMMGNATAAERTSESVFLPAAQDSLLRELQARLAALAQLPLAHVTASEDLQLVHYSPGAQFGMHHDSSAFLPRLLTAFYYLNDVEGGGETVFPAADGAMSPDDALKLAEPATAGTGLVVRPARGAALLWYNHDADGARDAFAVHAGCRVTAGEKWGANHWVRVGGGGGAGGGMAASAQASAGSTAVVDGRSDDEAAAADEREEEQGTAEGSTDPGKNAARNKKKREKAAGKRRAAAAEQHGAGGETEEGDGAGAVDVS